MFEQAFKNIDDVLYKDAGCTSELDYTEQTSWLLFLKYLDALEADKATEAALEGRNYNHILDTPYRWESWAAPKGKDGQINHNTALTGDDLIAFVNAKLFPYLHGFKAKATGPNTIEYKIGEIFGEIKNRIQSGYNLREIIDHIDELRFASQTQKHELSHLYEAKIKNMGNAGRNGGEYYTPRPLIRAIVAVTAPRLGETICDPAVGSAGFLCESFDYLKAQNPKRTVAQDRFLQEQTLYGKEKKSLAYVIAIMNMILHGIEAPNIIHTNTLAENLADVQEKDRFHIIVANPPFGGKERKEVQQNFPIRTGETATLFLQHFIKILRAGGRGGVVIKETFLTNTDNASISMRKLLLESCNLHTVLSNPRGAFVGTGEKTVVLFFEKGSKTRSVWFYELDPGRSLGKTAPLNDDDLAEFIALQRTFADSPKSWSVEAKAIDQATFDLSVKNPNGGEVITHRNLDDITDEIAVLDSESASALEAIQKLLALKKTSLHATWSEKHIGEILQLEYGKPLDDAHRKPDGLYPVYGANGEKARSDKFYVSKPSIIVGRKGSAGEVNLTEAKFWPLDVTYFVTFDENEYDLHFLYHLLKKLNLPSLARGVKPGINRNEVYSKKVIVPDLAEQQRIVAKMSSISVETERLDSTYQRKLAALNELKESLLHQVFTRKT
jgi:type I restriction enzyme M protein